MRFPKPFADRIVLPPHTPRGCESACSAGRSIRRNAAHRAASLIALRRLRLDAVWWLVTPGNPLKDVRALPPIEERIAAARRPRTTCASTSSDLEAVIKTRYTYDTVAYSDRALSLPCTSSG